MRSCGHIDEVTAENGPDKHGGVILPLLLLCPANNLKIITVMIIIIIIIVN